MTGSQIRFDDGASYERMMGRWTNIIGNVFLDWLAPAPNLSWVDIGCGNGAFTELLVDRCAAKDVRGIDPSEGQLAYARTRPAAKVAEFMLGDAMALPFPDQHFDAAVMALVIFFVPEPARGVAEMARVVRPGGSISAYAWDVLNGGFPHEPIRAELLTMGVSSLLPPSAAASQLAVLHDLWSNAGLEAVETRQITAQRTFADFDDFWATSLLASSVAPTVGAMSAPDVARLRDGVRARLPIDASSGRVTCTARANAIKGRTPRA